MCVRACECVRVYERVYEHVSVFVCVCVFECRPTVEDVNVTFTKYNELAFIITKFFISHLDLRLIHTCNIGITRGMLTVQK